MLLGSHREGSLLSRRERLYSIPELRDVMAERGIVKSREEWQRRARAGQFGQKVGRDYVVCESELQAIAESADKDA